MIQRLITVSRGIMACVLLALSGSVCALGAQAEPPALWLMPDTAGVMVQLPQVPSEFHGFHVYRSAAEGFVRLTVFPVRPTRDLQAFIAAVGDDAPRLEDLTRAPNALQMARRLQSDPVVGTVYGYLFPSVADATGRRWRDSTAASGATYRYRVVFVDAAGEETAEGREASVNVTPVLPAAPTALRASTRATAVTLRWDFPRYAGGERDVTVGYHVYRGLGSLPPTERRTISPIPRDDRADAAYADNDVVRGTRYTYLVRAVDVLGREGAATPIVGVGAVDTVPPSAPTTVVAAPAEGRVRLTWRIPPELDLASYRVERSTGLDAPYTTVHDAVIPADAPILEDSSVIGGVQYFYRVVAINRDGRESAPSNPANAIPFDNTPPPAPQNLRASVRGREIVLQWEGTVATDLAGYFVYRGESDDRLVRVTPEPVAATTFRDRGFDGEGLVPGARYLLRVTAVDSMRNESTPIETTVTLPDDVAPGAPSGLVVLNPVGRFLELRWSAAADLDVAVYEVGRAASDAEALVVRDTIAAEAMLVYRDADVVSGERYRYVVTAVDRAGNRGEGASVETRYVAGVPPASPNFVEVRVGAAGVEVRWERVASRDVRGYRVYRATLPTGVPESVSPLIPADSPLQYVDPAGSAGLYYRVTAVNAAGEESKFSVPTRAERAP